MGWLSHGGYCIKCAIKDGWAKAEVGMPNCNSPSLVSCNHNCKIILLPAAFVEVDKINLEFLKHLL